MSKRIGVVTGGGDCPGLNAVIRAVAKASANRGWECIGVLGGYEGLLEPRRTIPLDYQILSGLLPRGGTILGTANRGRFSAKVGHGEKRAGGSPTTFDRALCSIFGATAVELVAAGEFGKMVAFTGPHIGAIKISDATGKIKVVRPDGNLVRTARALGICFGD
jgi:6-phosphofructokinase